GVSYRTGAKGFNRVVEASGGAVSGPVDRPRVLFGQSRPFCLLPIRRIGGPICGTRSGVGHLALLSHRRPFVRRRVELSQGDVPTVCWQFRSLSTPRRRPPFKRLVLLDQTCDLGPQPLYLA